MALDLISQNKLLMYTGTHYTSVVDPYPFESETFSKIRIWIRIRKKRAALDPKLPLKIDKNLEISHQKCTQVRFAVPPYPIVRF